MDQTNTPLMTPFDSIIQTNQLQMLKAADPHMPQQSRKSITIFIKLMELKNAFNVVGDDDAMLKMCSASVEPETPVTMLNDIRSFCTEKQQEQIDMLINFFEMYDTYESLFSQ